MGTMGKLNHKLGCNVMGNLYHDVCAEAKIEVNCGDLTVTLCQGSELL